MDIRNWGLDKVMSLPDSMFGRKWPISVSSNIHTEGTDYDIAEIPLPDQAVIWHLSIQHEATLTASSIISLALGDVLPTTDAQFYAYEPVFSSLGTYLAGNRIFGMQGGSGGLKIPMRHPIRPQGRRLVGRFEIPGNYVGTQYAIIVISSLPKEVPDCLLSV